jgi:MYXO-CTERM domain-containing protein
MRRSRLTRLCWVAATVGVLSSASTAHAFYWYGWPGSKLPPVRTIIPPPHDKHPGNPPDRPPVNPPPDTTPPGSPTPEPATALTALIGLGALAARRVWQSKKQ